jgi:hypothetical protein
MGANLNTNPMAQIKSNNQLITEYLKERVNKSFKNVPKLQINSNLF